MKRDCCDFRIDPVYLDQFFQLGFVAAISRVGSNLINFKCTHEQPQNVMFLLLNRTTGQELEIGDKLILVLEPMLWTCTT